MDTTEQNIKTLTQAFDALNRGDIDAVIESMISDFIINIAEMPYSKRGVSAWRDHAKTLLAAFPDASIVVEDIFGIGDKVAVRVRLAGTHTGYFLGMAPTGKSVSYVSHEIYRFENGKLAEEWICSDMMTLFTQIGALSKWTIVSVWLSGYRMWLGGPVGAIGGAIIAYFLL